MTPGALARECCGNWTNGICLGGGFRALPNGELRHFVLEQDGEQFGGRPCRVGRGQRCEFFERMVLPVAESPGEVAARTTYVSKFPVDRFAGTGRYCSCGEPIPRRRRVCDSCREARRRASRRNSYHRKRPTGQLTDFRP